MSRFLEALERIENARKGSQADPQEKRVEPTEEPPMDGAVPRIGNARSSHKLRARRADGETAQGIEPWARSSALATSSLDPHLVSLVAPTAFESDQYRTLRHIVEQKHTENGLDVLAVTSPSMGDGKTLTSINLAGALAQDPDARVLLVDADLRRPSIFKQLGTHDSVQKGMVDAVLDRNLGLRDLVTSYPAFNLSVICAGPPPSAPYEFLKAARFGEILREARSRFDYVVVDTPPLVPFTDCRLIGQWVDGFIVVVSSMKTSRSHLEEGLKVLGSEKVLGIVFNSDGTLAPARYDYYYDRRRHSGPERLRKNRS